MANDTRDVPRAWVALFDDDEEDALPARECADCGATAPATPSFHSLISAKHGWRLLRVPRERGAPRMDWLCPKCWANRRARPATSDPPSSHERARIDISSVPPPGPDASPSEMRSTGAFEMLSSTCKSLTTKLQSRARPGGKKSRLLRAVGEIETEISSWTEKSGTPERRAEVWAELCALNLEAEELLSSKG